MQDRSLFRRHQDQFGEICYNIRTGRTPHVRHIICSITPGGGKSMLPIIAASQLIGTVADRICWVVPRRSLQSQAEAEFLKPRTRALLGHNHVIRRSTNEPDPCRGLSGFATTYQAIGMGNAYLREEFSKHRYILVLDEPHHVEEGGAWEAALAPLMRRAAITVLMSGTLERGNRQRIAFLPYREGTHGETVDLHGSRDTSTIIYSRRDALIDRAVLPIHFELMDGTASWVGRDGKTYHSRISAAAGNTSEAIYTALKTQFGEHLLNETIGHWQTYRETHPRSKLLVVTANIEEARKYLKYVKAQGVRAAIATSDDSTQAAANIESFKKTEGRGMLDALVTVAMAYEGLDVPPITHIACLTHIRSKPWIEQMIARATRFDPDAGPWEEQMAYVYVPDDRNMSSIVLHMQDEQIASIKLRGEMPDELQQAEPPAPGEERNSIVPLGSEGGTRRWSRVGQHFSHNIASQTPLITPSQQEADLRDRIQDYCKQVDLLYFDRKWGETNKRVVKTFQKSRAEMTLKQLQKVEVWLEYHYPLERAKAAPRGVNV